MSQLESAREVITALGGLKAVSDLTGRKTTTVSKWQAKFDAFPSATYFVMQAELRRLGLMAPARLWRFDRQTADA